MGHECRVLTTARFEARVPFTIAEHLKQRGVNVADGESVVEYQVGRVPVTLLMTRHNDEARPNRAEALAIWRCSRA